MQKAKCKMQNVRADPRCLDILPFAFFILHFALSRADPSRDVARNRGAQPEA